MNRRRMIRRGATYGPYLPDGAADDGADRGIAAFVICGSLIRQFEFAQNVWVNDRNFHELGNERDPIIGNQDGTLEFKIPKRPIRKKIVGLPAFTTVRGGAYFLPPWPEGAQLSGVLELIGSDNEKRATSGERPMPTSASARTYNQNHVHRKYTPGKRRISIYWTWSYPWEAQRDPAAMENPLLHHDGGPERSLASVRDAGMERGAIPPGHRRNAGIVPPPLHAQLSRDRGRGRPAIPSPCSSASIRPGSSSRSTGASSPTPTR